MGMHQNYEGEDQRREYSRVEAYVPFEYRIVAPGETGNIKARISGNTAATEFRPIPDLGEHDPVFGEWMKLINAKLDTIFRLLTLQHEGYCGLSYKTVNISGGGMSFPLPDLLPLGETLEIKLTLTLQQPVVLCIYGEVVKADRRDKGCFIAVHYVHMEDSIRDEIIRFVFEREREIIREKRR